MIDIKLIVANNFEIEVEDLSSRSRKRNIVDGRRAYSFIMREHFKRNLVNIGTDLDRDHATIMNLVKTHHSVVFYDKSYEHMFEKCVQDIEDMPDSKALSNRFDLINEINADLIKVKKEILRNKREMNRIFRRQEEILSSLV